jgi:hypothetical protein
MMPLAKVFLGARCAVSINLRLCGSGRPIGDLAKTEAIVVAQGRRVAAREVDAQHRLR